MTEPKSSAPVQLQERLVALTRAFGWHRPNTTPCGVSVTIAEAHALIELSHGVSLTQQQLGSALNLRKSSVSGIVAKLERRGWLARRRNGQDGRVRDVSLTAAGEQAARDLAVAREARIGGVLARIPEPERAAVLRSLQTLIEAIHEDSAREDEDPA